MSESTFNLFGPISKDDIRVGYISSERGYVDGVSICDANLHAKNNPGETFIFKPDKKTVKFLNINQVNKLAINPTEATTDNSCPDGLDMEGKPGPVKAVFMGGGGIGVVGNPVIGDDGSVMAVDLVDGGYGYKYPPLVKIQDDSGIGAGAVVEVSVGEVADQTIYYSDKEDFEDYQICENGYGKEPYGKRWGTDGKDLGPWIPKIYTEDTEKPFEQVVDQYVKLVRESGKDWFATRKEPPLKITSNGQTTKEIYDVDSWMWGGTISPFTEVEFEIHWHSPHRTKGLGFEFVAQDKSHSFRIVDTGKKNSGRMRNVYQVKENVIYDIKPIGKRASKQQKIGDDSKVIELAEVGLLKQMRSFRSLGSEGNVNELKVGGVGEGDKIFADFLDTLDDADDLQVQANRGKFNSFNPRRVQGLTKQRTTYDLTYRLMTGKKVVEPSFMNKYAISPKPKSNVKGSDFAGRWYTFEWDKEFPYDGDYIFRGACDNLGKVYLDNQLSVSYTHLTLPTTHYV